MDDAKIQMDRLINWVTSSFTASRSPDHIPTSLPKCTACIGHGSFGLVLKAIDTATKSTTAVKFLLPYSEDEKRIMRECSITASLQAHENVVRVIQVIKKQFTLAGLNQFLPRNLFKTEKQNNFRALYEFRLTKVTSIRGFLIQMELCGENLRKWLRKQISLQDVDLHYQQFIIVGNITAGLTYLHNNQIMHRDLKPENLMFTKIGFVLPVKIGDFGLSRNLYLEESQNSTPTSGVGTLDYRAPESSTRQYSFPVDLYSLGLIIWEVVQLIKFNERKNLFDRLVNDNDYELVKLPPLLEGFRGLIIALSKRYIVDRLKTMQEVNLFIFNSKITLNIFAKDEEELRTFLRYAIPGSKVTLLAKEYHGDFIVQGRNITIIGQKETTIIGNTDTVNCVSVTGFDHKIENLAILHPGKDETRNCLKVNGKGHSFGELKISGGVRCIVASGSDHKFEKMTLTDSAYGIDIIEGSRIVIKNLRLYSIARRGIYISENSHTNIVENVTGNNVRKGIVCFGQDNTLSNIKLPNNNNERGFGRAKLWAVICILVAIGFLYYSRRV